MIVLLRPVTDAACVWVRYRISQDSTEWDGGIVIEPRYVQGILDGIDSEGLTVGPWPDWMGWECWVRSGSP